MAPSSTIPGCTAAELMDRMGDEFERCAGWLAAALEHSCGTQTLEDVRAGIAAGRFHLWPGEHAAIVTELVTFPRAKVANYFLAGGDLAELEQMVPSIERWAMAQGCTLMTLAGRRGWVRSFLTRDGYREQFTVISKELTSCAQH